MNSTAIKTKNSIKHILFFSAVLFSIVFINGCSPNGQSDFSSAPKADTVIKANEKPAPISYTVEIKGMKFEPEEIRIHAGDTVTWVNHDMVAHNVTEELTKTWTSDVLPPDKSWQMAVTKSADYYCNIHTSMKGKIIIE